MTDDPNHHRHRKQDGEGNGNGNGRGNGGDGGDHPGKRWGSNRRISGIDLTTQTDSDTAVTASQTRGKNTPQEGEPTIKGVSAPTLVAVGFTLGEIPVAIPSKPGKVSENTTTVNATATATESGIKATGLNAVGDAVGNAQLGVKSTDGPVVKMETGATIGGRENVQTGKQIKAEGDATYTEPKKAPKSEDTAGGDKGGGPKQHEERSRGPKELTPEAPPKKEEGPKKEKPETHNTDGKSGHKQDNNNENKDDHRNDAKKDEHKDPKGDKDGKGDHKDGKDKDGQKADVKNDPKDKHDDKPNKNDGDKDKDQKRDNDRATNEKTKENDRDRNRDKDGDRDDKRKDSRDADRERIVRGSRDDADRRFDGKLRDEREGKRGERDHDDKGRRLEDDRTRRHEDEKLTAARLHQILRDVEDRIVKPGDKRVFGRDPRDAEGRDPRGHEGKDHRGADGKEHRGTEGRSGDRSGRANDHAHNDGRAENERRITLAVAIRELLDILRRGSENTRHNPPQNETPRPNRPEIPVNRPPERPERPEWPAGRENNNGQRPENTRRDDMREPTRAEQFVRSPEHAAALAAMQQMMLQQQKQMEMDGRTPQPGELTPAQMAAILNGLNNEQLQALLEELAREKDKEGRNRRPQTAQQPILEEGEKRPIKKQQTDGQEAPQQQRSPEKKAEDEEEDEELLEENDQNGRGPQFVLINGVLIPVQPTTATSTAGTAGGGSSDPMNANGVAAVFIDPNSVLPELNLDDFGGEPRPEDRRDADPSYISAEQTQPVQPVPRLNLQPQLPTTNNSTTTTTTTQPSVANVQHTEITVSDIQKFLNHLLGTNTGTADPDGMFDHETDFRGERDGNPDDPQNGHRKSMRDLLGQRPTNPDVALATLLNDAKKSRNYVMDQLIATMEGRKTHVVKEGESLEDIARKTFEDERVAELIYRMNSKHIPAKLIAGWKVRVRLVPNMKLVMPLQPEVEKYLEQLNKAKAPTRKKYEYEPARTTTMRK